MVLPRTTAYPLMLDLPWAILAGHNKWTIRTPYPHSRLAPPGTPTDEAQPLPHFHLANMTAQVEPWNSLAMGIHSQHPTTTIIRGVTTLSRRVTGVGMETTREATTHTQSHTPRTISILTDEPGVAS